MMIWRKIILSLLVACGAMGAVCAQSYNYTSYKNSNTGDDMINRSAEMGVMVGANYMDITPSTTEMTLAPKIGFRGGVHFSLVWEHKYALQMEVAYAFNKIDATMQGSTVEVSSNVVEVPVMFSYRGLKPLRVGAGIVLSPIASGRYVLGYERLEFGQVRPTVGWIANVGVNLTRRLLLDARFVGGFGSVQNALSVEPMTDNKPLGQAVEFRTRSWQAMFSLGYMF
jgi:hypothetical protein